MNVTVIGGSKCSEESWAIAYRLGKLIACEGWVLICGGQGGVMEAVCQGVKEEGGLAVGILPDSDTTEANSYLNVKIPTGLGYARNILVVRAADSIIAVDGEYGTLSEIAFALNEGKTVYGINTWGIKGVIEIKSPEEAIEKIKKNIG